MLKKKKKKSIKKPRKMKDRSEEYDNAFQPWPEKNLSWVPMSNLDGKREDGFSIISWNVLADSYCSPSSHKHLPMQYQRHVFDRSKRQHSVRQTLRLLACLETDMLALQEVDAPLGIPSCMEELGFEGVATETCTGGSGRIDACALYWRKERWSLETCKTVRLDDLALLCSKGADGKMEAESTSYSNLQGLQRSFVRKNMALLVRLKSTDGDHEVVVAVAHLYWNPLYSYVKLCQAHYVAKLAQEFSAGTPIVICGDFNSQPGSHVHRYLVNGFVNGKMAAPWNHVLDKQKEDGQGHVVAVGVEGGGLAGAMDHLSLDEMTTDSQPPPTVRYLLDFTLNRFTRWLRILGIDAALETEDEEKRRTKDGDFVIVERCRKENRSLITTSAKLLLRRDCPPGAYLLDTKSLSNLEMTLVHLLLSHGVVLKPKAFLSRCVVCNGTIQRVHDEEKIQSIFTSHQAPDALKNEVLDVFQCSNCGQGYWWCDRPTSSASRVKNQATKLLETCIRGGVPIDPDMGMFGFVDAERVRETGAGSEEGSLLNQRLDVVEWLQEKALQNPCGPLTSAYACAGQRVESLPFTNVTSDFVGHLDYIFYQASRMEVTSRLYVPKSFDELNDKGIRNGHLLPSSSWPSDHLAIGARLVFPNKEVSDQHCESAQVADMNKAVGET